MRRIFSNLVAAIAIGAVLYAGGTQASAADEYDYDLVHSSVSFKARHLDISWIHGRFNEVAGKFVLDREDPTKSTFQLTIQADSVDTANKAARRTSAAARLLRYKTVSHDRIQKHKRQADRWRIRSDR